jgi:hypothetical protein
LNGEEEDKSRIEVEEEKETNKDGTINRKGKTANKISFERPLK